MRSGQRVSLEPRALAVLLLMVRSNGRLLKKDAILDAVWKNTVVEESTLSRAVAILRKQLGDDPRHPTFIETVPTFGYRFIAKVRERSATDVAETAEAPPATADAALAQAATSAAGVGSASSAALTEEPPRTLGRDLGLGRVGRGPGQGQGRPASRRLVWTGAAGAALLAAASAFWLFRPSHALLWQKSSIVLADFANSTGEAVFDGTLREGMIVQLEQSPVLSLLSERQIQSTLRLMGQDAEVRLTPRLGREVCQRTGSGAVLEGSIASLGGQYVLGLRATRCATGEVIDTEQVQAKDREDVFRALDQIASRFRTRVGESLSSVSTRDVPLAEATTSSLEALKDYSQANRVANSTGSAAAIPLLERAIALDPQFAIAHAMLGRVYGDVGQESRSALSTAEAYKFRNHASERERFFIAASYDMQVTGNLEKAEETCETWARVYPRENGALGFRTGVILRVFGQYEEAAELGRKLIDLDPDFAIAYHLLVVNEIALGRLNEAKRVLDAAASKNLEIPFFLLDRYRLAFLTGDTQALERVAASAARQPATEDLIAGQLAASFAYAGRLSESRGASNRAVSLAVQSGRPELAARFEASAALIEALLGNADEAARHATAVLDLSKGRDAEYGAALALALGPNPAPAAALVEDLEKRFPEDTSAHFIYVPTIRAMLALNRGEPQRAIELLRVTEPYGRGTPPSSFLGLYGALYPAFVRGQSYLALHRGAEAAAEFETIVNHRVLTGTDPIGSLAYLELGRARLIAGDPVRAKAAYAEFLNRWKGADQDLPTLKATVGEYSRL